MTFRRLAVTAAAVTAAAAATGCGTSQVDGIIVPAGLSTYQQLTDIIDRHDMVVQIVYTTTADNSDDTYTFDGTFFPNGDINAYAFSAEKAERMRYVGGVTYVDDGTGAGWNTADDTDQIPTTVSDVIENLYQFTGDGTEQDLAETENGYQLTLYDGAALQFLVDRDRRFVGTAVDGGPTRTEIFYPIFVRPPAIPVLATLADDQTADQHATAIGTVEDAVDIVDALLADHPLPDITPAMFAAAHEGRGVYVDTETAFDLWSVGFANDGGRIELVSSDGTGTCWRATIDADRVRSATTSDSNGVPNDLGYVCATNTPHTGAGLYD